MNTVDVADFKIYCTNDIEKYRAESFLEKEPETIEWIKSFSNGDTVFDVGANIGIYSLYIASLYPKCSVYSFEPHIPNCERLKANIELNDFSNVFPHIFIVGKENKMIDFYFKDMEVGSTGSQLGYPIDEYGKKFNPQYELKINQLTVDTLADKYEVPNHIKIDVDGHEEDVIKGMEGVIQNGKLKSILIECNRDCIDVSKLIQKLEWYGLTLDNKFNRLENHSRIRRGNNPQNLIFTREV